MVRFVSILYFCRVLPLVFSAAPMRDIVGIRLLLEKYCFDCHGEKKQKDDLRLDTYLTGVDVLKDRKIWLSVLEQLEKEEMPPEDPLPTAKEYEKLTDWVDAAVNPIDWDSIKHPGHVTLPRLTRSEYNNTIRDLFGLDTKPGRIFSLDGEGQSVFGNDRDNLFLTASEMEKYFTAAEIAVKSLVSLNARSKKWHFEAEKMFMTEGRPGLENFGDGSQGYTLTSWKKTRAVKEGDRNLLDNSIVLYGSGMKNGNGHVKNNLPLLVAGKGAGALEQAQLLAQKKGALHANLLHTLGLEMGLEQEHFNNAITGMIDELLT